MPNIDDPFGFRDIVNKIDLNKPAGEELTYRDGAPHINGIPACPQCGQLPTGASGSFSYGGSQVCCGQCAHIYDKNPVEQWKQDMNKGVPEDWTASVSKRVVNWYDIDDFRVGGWHVVVSHDGYSNDETWDVDQRLANESKY